MSRKRKHGQRHVHVVFSKFYRMILPNSRRGRRFARQMFKMFNVTSTSGLRTIFVLACTVAGLAACSTTGAHYENSKTHPDGSSEVRRVGFNSVRVRDDAPQEVGELLNIASPFMPTWILPAGAAVLGALGLDVAKRPARQKREDRLYDEAYDKGRGDKPPAAVSRRR